MILPLTWPIRPDATVVAWPNWPLEGFPITPLERKLAWLKTLNISSRKFNATLSVILVSFSRPASVLIVPGPLKEYCGELPVTPQTSYPQLRPLANEVGLKYRFPKLRV